MEAGVEPSHRHADLWRQPLRSWQSLPGSRPQREGIDELYVDPINGKELDVAAWIEVISGLANSSWDANARATTQRDVR
jgi:hypothetical protein